MGEFDGRSKAEEVAAGIDLSGKHAIVTGANTGIGQETARVLALSGASVTLACRSLERGEHARQRILSSHGQEIAPEALQLMELDLGHLQSVRDFASAFLDSGRRIDLLINNAGVMLPRRRETRDGFEAHFGINHLGHFLLTRHLLDRIRESAPARIVSVSSEAMKFASLTPALADLNWEERRFSGWRSYGDSKLMNLLFTGELNRRLADSGVVAAAVHPGIVTTELARDQSWWMKLFGIGMLPFMKNVAQGAATTLYAATRPEILERGGDYFADCAPAKPGKLAGNREVEEALWKRSEELTSG